MNLKDAIERGKQITETGRKNALKSRQNNLITYQSLLLIFRTEAERLGVYSYLPLAKSDFMKIRGLAKVLRNNGCTCEDTRDILKKMCQQWDELQYEMVTLKGKKWTPLATPNLRDFAICRISILNMLSVKQEPKVDENMTTAEIIASL